MRSPEIFFRHYVERPANTFETLAEIERDCK